MGISRSCADDGQVPAQFFFAVLDGEPIVANTTSRFWATAKFMDTLHVMDVEALSHSVW